MSPKISVQTSIFRPGYIDTITQALKDQTFTDFELVLIDDLWEQRKDVVREYVGDAFALKHIAPRVVSTYAMPCAAMNTGFIHSEGELIYFMNDYMYLHPRTLERHWKIYSKYGPKVIISGPLIDAFAMGAKPLLYQVTEGEPPRPVMPLPIRDDEGNISLYCDEYPPIALNLKDNFEQPVPDNLISVFKQFFKPLWPENLPPDQRTKNINKEPVAENLYQCNESGWYWSGRNDSAPLRALLDVNGVDEAFDGRRGGSDGNLADRLMQYGCRYLFDTEVPCQMLPHPSRKKALLSEEERLKQVVERGKNRPKPYWVNDYNLREERAKIGLDKPQSPDVSIVSAHAGPLKLLKQCINTARENTSIPYEHIIVADAPDEETQEFLAAIQKEGIVVITNPELGGQEAAQNQGRQSARGKYLAEVSTDILLAPGAIDIMRAALKSYPRFGWVSPSCEYTGFFAGCSMCTREAHDEVGPFDETFRGAFTDDDYLRRMWEAGYKPHIVSGVKVDHRHPSQTAKALFSDEEFKKKYAINQNIFYDKWGQNGTNWDALPRYKPEDNSIVATVELHRIFWIRSKVNPDNTILEVGCAENQVWRNTKLKVTTLDKSTRPDDNCFPDVEGEAENLPFKFRTFDVVNLGELLEHVADPQRVLREAIRVARQKVIVTVPWEHEWPEHLKPFWNPSHVRFYTLETFEEELQKAGLPCKIEKIRKDEWTWLGAEIYCEGGEFMSDPIKRINVGSFVVMLPGDWLNLDIEDLTDFAKENGFAFQQCDVRKGLPFEDNSIDLVNSSHMIEHLTVEEGVAFLRECHRVLQPGSVVRIGTPNLPTLVEAYQKGEMDQFNDTQPQEYKDAPSQADKFWRLLTAGHKTCFDWDALKHSFELAGFKDIYLRDYNRELDMFPELSIYIEAKKAATPITEVEQFMKEKREGRIPVPSQQQPQDIPECWQRFATEKRMEG